MDVIRELRWVRWGPMKVREVEGDHGSLKILTPAGKAEQRYDVFRQKRPFLDDLLEAADSEQRRAAHLSAFGADEKSGAEAFRRADEIHERDVVAAASRWGFLTTAEAPAANEVPFEPFHLWERELLNLRQASDLLVTGGNLSSLALRLYAHSLVDQPAIERSPAEGRLDEHGFWWKPGSAARALQRDRRAEGARGLLELALTRQLSRGGVEVVLEGARYALRPTSLLAAAWLQLGDRVLRARPEKTCPKCGNVFVPPTARRVFCSEKCKDDAKNMRRSKRTRRNR